MTTAVTETGMFKALSATDATIKAGFGTTGKLLGIFCSSTTAGTLAVTDSSGTIAATFSPAAGSYTPLPADFTGTLTITVGGTIAYTVFYIV